MIQKTQLQLLLRLTYQSEQEKTQHIKLKKKQKK